MAYRRLALTFRLVAAIALVLSVFILPVSAQGICGLPPSTPEATQGRDLTLAPRSAPAIQGLSPVIAHVLVGSYPFGIAVNPITHRVYVANRYGHSVSVIDGSSNTVMDTIPVGADPWAQVALDVNANRVYVPNNGSGSLSVIDGASNTVIATVSELESAPEGVAVHTGLNRIYVSHSANRLSVIDGTTDVVTGVLDTGNFNHNVLVDENADRAYVSRTAPLRTSIMDLETGVRVGELDVSGFMAFNAKTNRLYIAEHESSGLTVVDTTTNSKIARIGIDSGGGSPAVNLKTNCVYVPNPGNGTVSVIDAAANVLVGTIGGLDLDVFAATADSEAGLVYVTELGANAVAVILATSCSADLAVTPTVTPTPTMTFTPTPTPTPTHTPTPVPGAIEGVVWYDANGNAALDEDEPGLYGVKVSLYRNGLMLGQQFTRGDGSYRFASLPPADYVIRELQPRWLRYSTTPDEAAVTVLAATASTANFGDWDGRRLYLPLIRRR